MSDLQIDPVLVRTRRGYLTKKTTDTKKWKRRFFVLKSELVHRNDSFELIMYGSERDLQKPLTVIVLDGAEVVAESLNRKDKGVKHEFQLYVAGGEIIELSADSVEERQEWLDTLGAIISAHRKRMHVGTGGMTMGAGGAMGGLYNILVTEDHAQSCETFGPGLFGAEAGLTTSFTIQATTSNSEPMIEGGLPFTATLENDTLMYNVLMMDNNDGTYSANYAVSAPGDYDLSLKLNDEHHIFGSPFAVRVVPGPAFPSKCVAKGDGLHHAKSMETAYFTIAANDALGNERKGGGDPFEVSVSGPAVLKGLQDNANGTYACAFEVTATADTVAQVPNAVRINVQLNGNHLPGSPYTPKLEAPDGQWEVVNSPEERAPTPVSVPAETFSVLSSSLPSVHQFSPQLSMPMPSNNNRESSTAVSKFSASLGAAPSSRSAEPSAGLAFKDNSYESRSAEPSAGSSFKDNNYESEKVWPQQQQRRETPKFTPQQVQQYQMPAPQQLRQSRQQLGQQQQEDSTPFKSPSKTPPEAPPMNNNLRQTAESLITPGVKPMSKLAQASARAKAARAAAAAGNDWGAVTPTNMTSNQQQAPNTNTNTPEASKMRKALREQERQQSFEVEQLSPTRVELGNKAPQDMPPDESKIWDTALTLMRDPMVLPLFESHSAHLMLVFHYYSSGMGNHYGHAVKTLNLMGASGQHKGVMQMSVDYDVTPSFLLKKEIKSCFSVVMRMQEGGGGTGLDFGGFIQLLGLLAVLALSKPSFQHLYPTHQAKVGVLLEMWGFADPIKLQHVTHDRR
jgi:hypothetical protein